MSISKLLAEGGGKEEYTKKKEESTYSKKISSSIHGKRGGERSKLSLSRVKEEKFLPLRRWALPTTE